MSRPDPARPARLFSAAVTMLALGAGSTDALSFAGLGNVFTSVMTGNLVLLGLAFGTAGEHDTIIRPGVAIAAYVAGVVTAARMLPRSTADRTHPWPPRVNAILTVGLAAQAAVLAGWLATAGHPDRTVEHLLIALAALAMGGQSRAVNDLAITGAATTYLTGTLTVLAAEVATVGQRVTMWRRSTMLVAALVGAVLEAILLTWLRPAAAALPFTSTVAALILSHQGARLHRPER